MRPVAIGNITGELPVACKNTVKAVQQRYARGDDATVAHDNAEASVAYSTNPFDSAVPSEFHPSGTHALDLSIHDTRVVCRAENTDTTGMQTAGNACPAGADN